MLVLPLEKEFLINTKKYHFRLIKFTLTLYSKDSIVRD